MSKEDLKRKMLAEHFIWFSNEAEAIAYDGNKSVYFPGSDGIYCKNKFTVGGNSITVIAKAKSCPLISAQTEGITDYNISNKIPGGLLEEIIGSFGSVCDKSGNEAAAQIYRKRDTNEHFIYYPEQTVSKSLVSYGDDPNIESLRKDNELVCELHSHDTMSAFWSGTDDSNETEVGFYVVLGNFDKDKCSYRARVKCGKTYKDLKLSDLFDITPEQEEAMLTKTNRTAGNEEIHKKIKETASLFSGPKVSNMRSAWYGRYSESYTGFNYENMYGDGSEDSWANYYASYYNRRAKKTNTVSEDDVKIKEDKVISITSSYNRDSAGELEYPEYINKHTQNYIHDIAADYNFKSIASSDLTTFLEAIDISEIHDSSAYVDEEDYVLGYKNTGTEHDILENLKLRVNAKVMRQFLVQADYFTGYNVGDEKVFYDVSNVEDAILDLDASVVVSYDFSSIAFWETLNRTEKAIIAYAFNMDIIDAGRFFYNAETINYYFLYLMYSLITCSQMGSNVFRTWINTVSEYYEDMMNDLGAAEVLENASSIEKVNDYLENVFNLVIEESTSASLFDIIEDADNFHKRFGNIQDESTDFQNTCVQQASEGQEEEEQTSLFA